MTGNTKRAIGIVAVGLVILWFVLAHRPFWLYHDITDAGSYGDAFGLVNAAFAGIGLLGVAVALILQWNEIHETSVMQDRQMQLAERTAQIQKETFADAKRRIVMDVFLKINRDMMRYRHAFLQMHRENNRPVHSQIVDEEVSRRLRKEYFDAWTELQSNCLAIGLLFDRNGDAAGREIQILYMLVHEWFEDKTPIPDLHECQIQIDAAIRSVQNKLRPLWEALQQSLATSSVKAD